MTTATISRFRINPRTRWLVPAALISFASIEHAPVTLDRNGNITMRIYLDRSSVEVFAQNGLRTITDQVFPNAGADKMALFADGGTAQLKSLTVTPLQTSMFLPKK